LVHVCLKLSVLFHALYQVHVYFSHAHTREIGTHRKAYNMLLFVTLVVGPMIFALLMELARICPGNGL